MEHLILNRVYSSSRGTLGILMLKGTVLFTIERPWKDNEPQVSCIPPGVYTCRYASDRITQTGKKILRTYEVQDVPNRSGILWHCGNNINDTAGCILVGLYVGCDRKLTLTDSRSGFARFMNYLGGAEAFELEIVCSDFSRQSSPVLS